MQSPLDTLTAPVREELVALARRAVEDGTSCPSVPPETDLGEAVEAGLVVSCDGGYQFADPDGHAQALASAYLPDALAAFGDLPELVGVVHLVWQNQHRGRSEHAPPTVHPAARLLADIADAGHDMGEIFPALVAADYPEPGGLPRDVPGINWEQRKIALKVALRGALPLLSLSAEAALAVGVAAAMYYEDTRGVGHNYIGLGALARDRPGLAREALNLVVTRHVTAEAASLVPHFIHGLYAADPDDALARALELTEHADPLLVQAGIFALGALAVQAGDARLDAVFERLEALSDEADPTLDRPVAMAVASFPILADLDRSLALLVRLAPRRAAASAVARAIADLSVHSGPIAYREALVKLAASTHLDGDGVEALRSALYNAASRDPELALDVMEAWAMARPSGGLKLSDALGYAIDEVPTEIFDVRLVRWLANGDRQLARAAAEVINGAWGTGRKWTFPVGALARLDTQRLFHIVRQTLGRVHNGRALAGLILSLFDLPGLPDDVASFVEERLVDFVAFTRPVETEEVLSAVDPAERPVAAAVSARVLAHVKARDDAYRALPRRTELVPPSTRSRAYVTARRRWERAIFDRVERENPSPLKDLFTQVPVRGGKGFIYAMHDGTLEVSAFELHQTEGYSVLGDVVDPVGQAYRRFVWVTTPLAPPPLPPRTHAWSSSRSSTNGRRRYPKRRYPMRRRPSRH